MATESDRDLWAAVVAARRELHQFPQDTLALLPELVDLAVSDRTHGWACEAIGHLRPEALIPALEPIIADHLDRRGDLYEYQCLSSLLGRIQAWDLLGGLVERALRSEDPEILEAGRSLESRYAFLDTRRDPPTEPNV